MGFLGVVAEDTPVITHPNNVTGLRFGPVQETVEKYLPEVRAKSDIVVVLSHIGYPADRMLAEKVKGIDIIIGAHSHTKVVDPPRIGGHPHCPGMGACQGPRGCGHNPRRRQNQEREGDA